MTTHSPIVQILFQYKIYTGLAFDLFVYSDLKSNNMFYRLFPRVKVVTELTKATNIRFMNFRAKEGIKDQGSNIAYMHRLPFMSGNVFSASMIDTLLYQTFGKPYLIELIRLLIGISQSAGSGNLTSVNILFKSG